MNPACGSTHLETASVSVAECWPLRPPCVKFQPTMATGADELYEERARSDVPVRELTYLVRTLGRHAPPAVLCVPLTPGDSTASGRPRTCGGVRAHPCHRAKPPRPEQARRSVPRQCTRWPPPHTTHSRTALRAALPRHHARLFPQSDHGDRYRRGLVQSRALHDLRVELNWSRDQFMLALEALADDVPTAAHETVFVPCLMTQCSDEQLEYWLPRALEVRPHGIRMHMQVAPGANRFRVGGVGVAVRHCRGVRSDGIGARIQHPGHRDDSDVPTGVRRV